MSSLWMAGAAAADTISRAYYEKPTARYAHGVLGDDIEYSALVIQSPGKPGKEASKLLVNKLVVRTNKVIVRLPVDHVFEDIAPRIITLKTSSGPKEAVMVVETDVRLGAQLALYSSSGVKLAATPHIGQRNRWLAPIGAGDLDGDGRIEVAYIDRPHLAKTLRVWRYENGQLSEVAAASGFSNHQIGWDYIEGGLRDCGNGPEMIVASGNWREVRAVRFDGSKLSSRRLGAYSAAAIKQAMACK
ncbi:VCBS repeat-containing protein [uncultured Pelagimonas sp.]|uniref:VCBS repeat-containing protein n=1 Tax=uncultured Pelagimonas sp. TaxID=1618102 RepID=UPI002628CA06|nr:VCBS repeat-containing protein [uncultured Pelagimonas sp.]